MSVTIEQIEAKKAEVDKGYNQLAQMVAAFKPPAPTVYVVPEASITLQPGERYAGLVLDDEGEPSHHLILLPGEAESVDWAAAKTFASKAGGELPSRREQSLLFANLKSEFQQVWYWSGEQYSGSLAWLQDFYNGYQLSNGKSAAGRARAVRRLSI